VFLVVTDQVIERKTIMASDKVDAGKWFSSIVLIKIAAPGEPVSELTNLSVVTSPVSADGIPVFSVPLRPEDRKSSYLISAGTDIPGFSYQLNYRDNRVLVDNIEK
jgi:hypothetical protein